MRTAATLLWLVALAAAEEPRAFVELVADHDEVYVDQQFRLTLRIGYDAQYFEKYAVQLFQQKLGVPVHVEAPVMEGRQGPQAGPAIALNDDVRNASVGSSVTRGGRTFTVLTLTKSMTFAEPGERTFAAPTLRYAAGTKFRDDFVHGRVAIDRRESVVKGRPVVLRVLPIPDDGRPARWTGAVGPLAIRTEASPRELDEGQSLELKLWVTGGGNVETLAAPVLADIGLEDFHVVGSLVSRSDAARLFTYTIRPLSAAIDEIPVLALPYFDPTPPAQYRLAKSQAIPVTIRARPRQPVDAPLSKRDGTRRPYAAVFGALLLLTVVILLGTRRRRKKRDLPSAAYQRFQARGDADLADAFADFLAGHLGCQRAAVISPDLKDRLLRAGLEEKLAATVARRMERLIAARYGGGDPKDPTLQGADDLVTHLDHVFAALAKKRDS